MAIVIRHEPDCGASRNVASVICASGNEPTIVDCLEAGWTRPQRVARFAAAEPTQPTALRTTKSPARDLGLPDPEVDDKTLMSAMLAHPALVGRPIVRTPKGVRSCRPSQTVPDLLDRLPPGPHRPELDPCHCRSRRAVGFSQRCHARSRQCR